ncbi:RpiB/LacA/LacB family sugar-phosphate isomerase [archaeon]|nr:RpiB/LacA/LacB family sugar-phosphate isomerase [archaeon]MBL7057293.1 RpiB/LacA/LacB family sugar-phosphate isomerase [Candidatus Woesearchaeota archaeon]
MKIYIGSDHGGFKLKEEVMKELSTLGIEFEDVSPNFDENDDYPDACEALGRKVAENQTRGIMICASGTGSAIAANKVKGVRAASLQTEELVYLARLHNDINLLCLKGLEFEKPINEIAQSGNYKNLLNIPSKVADVKHAMKLIKLFLETDFEAGRHERRVKKIEAMEE